MHSVLYINWLNIMWKTVQEESLYVYAKIVKHVCGAYSQGVTENVSLFWENVQQFVLPPPPLSAVIVARK